MNSAWIGLIGALGGVLLTGLIGLATAALTQTWQRNARQRERLDHLNENRADLRRTAYTRFLVAGDALWEFILHQPAQEIDENDPMADIFERLRALRKTGEQQFNEFDASYLHLKLLCGSAVEKKLTDFHDWFIQQFVTAMQQRDIMQSEAVKGLEAAREPLIAAMKQEQEADLGFRGAAG